MPTPPLGLASYVAAISSGDPLEQDFKLFEQV